LFVVPLPRARGGKASARTHAHARGRGEGAAGWQALGSRAVVSRAPASAALPARRAGASVRLAAARVLGRSIAFPPRPVTTPRVRTESDRSGGVLRRRRAISVQRGGRRAPALPSCRSARAARRRGKRSRGLWRNSDRLACPAWRWSWLAPCGTGLPTARPRLPAAVSRPLVWLDSI
jgi:hypothetical protein